MDSVGQLLVALISGLLLLLITLLVKESKDKDDEEQPPPSVESLPEETQVVESSRRPRELTAVDRDLRDIPLKKPNSRGALPRRSFVVRPISNWAWIFRRGQARVIRSMWRLVSAIRTVL